MLRRVAPLVLLLAPLVACSGASHPKATTVTTPADALAALAGKGAAASYSASYTFHQVTPDTTATVQVWRASPSLRVDVVAGGTTATLLVTPAGSYSCSITGAKRSCLLVAGAGQPVPQPFDVAPANLFTADLRTLAANTEAYDVRSAPPLPSSVQCFDVAPRSSASPSPVPAGRYCFTPAGLLDAATYPSGNTIQLTSAQTTAPDAGQFTPYAKPTPLPS